MAGSCSISEPFLPANGNPDTLRIGLFGLFGSGNFGNDGSLEAMIAHLRQNHPDAQLLAICDGPPTVEERYGISAIPMMATPIRAPRTLVGKIALTLPAKIANFFRAISHTRRLDAIIMPGTGLLDDFSTGPLGIPLDLFSWCLAARLTRTRIMFVSVGAGPLVHPISRWLMTSAGRMAHLRTYRDQASKTCLARLGVETQNDPIYPDIAFSLPPASKLPLSRDGTDMTVGIGVMAYRGWRAKCPDGETIHSRYLDELCQFAEWLIEGGHTLRLISGDDCDRETVTAFEAKLKSRTDPSDHKRIVSEPVTSLHDVFSQMAKADCIVATRFHNIVCALKMGRPTLSIGYAQKNRVLLESAGLQGFSSDIETFDAATLKHQFRTLCASRADIEVKISGFNADTIRLLTQQYRMLDQQLRSLARPPLITAESSRIVRQP